MLDNLNEIEIKILDILYDIKYANKIYFTLENNIFNLENNMESIKEISYYLEKLKEYNYILYKKLPLIQRYICDKEYIYIDWYDICLLNKGHEFIEYYREDEKRKEVANLIHHAKKQKIEKDIKIISSHDTYYEISIKAENKVVNGIKIDKHLLYKIREYSWFVNNYNNIVTYRGLSYGIKRNKAIYQILFEEEINKINQETGSSHIAHFINGDKLDNRRENIIFIPKGKQALYKKLNKVTGIYLSSSNTEDNKCKRQVLFLKFRKIIFPNNFQFFQFLIL